MKLGPITKVALAGGLLLGQTQPTDKFYEDDEDFNLTSAVLSQGWNWSINQAQAADECTNNESTSAEQCIEHIEVEGEPYDPLGDLSLNDLEAIQYEEIEPQTTTGGTTQYGLEEYTEVVDCPSQAQQDYEVCKNNSIETANSSFNSCYKLYWDNTALYNSCSESVINIHNIDVNRCLSIKQEQLKQCP